MIVTGRSLKDRVVELSARRNFARNNALTDYFESYFKTQIEKIIMDRAHHNSCTIYFLASKDLIRSKLEADEINVIFDFLPGIKRYDLIGEICDKDISFLLDKLDTYLEQEGFECSYESNPSDHWFEINW